MYTYMAEQFMYMCTFNADIVHTNPHNCRF